MTDSKELVSDELRERVEELAKEQNRAPAEVLEDAVNHYAAKCRLERVQRRLGAKAEALGIREEDIPRLVEEVRREKQRER